MCPICLSTLGWLTAGGAGGSGVLAMLAVSLRKREKKGKR